MMRPLSVTVAVIVCALLTSCSPPRPDRPVIGAKNFTEQVILGELLAQEIEAKSDLKVERRFYLAGSYICQQALVAGRIDAYVEYTGTALTAVLKQPVDRDPESVLRTVRRLYATRYGVTVAEPLGFENTFAMVIRGDDARHNHLTTMDLGLLYRALTNDQVDMIAANSTDGPIQALGLTMLQDDKHYFPPYQAVPLVRDDALKRWPRIQSALTALAGKVTEEDVRAMNQAVDGRHRDLAEVVREFRSQKGL